jgi:hypothetical protein
VRSTSAIAAPVGLVTRSVGLDAEVDLAGQRIEERFQLHVVVDDGPDIKPGV